MFERGVQSPSPKPKYFPVNFQLFSEKFRMLNNPSQPPSEHRDAIFPGPANALRGSSEIASFQWLADHSVARCQEGLFDDLPSSNVNH
jgi:hypothetical protein